METDFRLPAQGMMIPARLCNDKRVPPFNSSVGAERSLPAYQRSTARISSFSPKSEFRRPVRVSARSRNMSACLGVALSRVEDRKGPQEYFNEEVPEGLMAKKAIPRYHVKTGNLPKRGFPVSHSVHSGMEDLKRASRAAAEPHDAARWRPNPAPLPSFVRSPSATMSKGFLIVGIKLVPSNEKFKQTISRSRRFSGISASTHFSDKACESSNTFAANSPFSSPCRFDASI